MKNILYFTVAVIFLTSCAAPKYTYNFDKYDYNSGRKAPVVSESEASALSAVAPELMKADASGVAPTASFSPATTTKTGINQAEIETTKKIVAKNIRK
jgi:hypothetical protein